MSNHFDDDFYQMFRIQRPTDGSSSIMFGQSYNRDAGFIIVVIIIIVVILAIHFRGCCRYCCICCKPHNDRYEFAARWVENQGLQERGPRPSATLLPSRGISDPPPPSSRFFDPLPTSRGFSGPPPPSSRFFDPPPTSRGFSDPPPPSRGFSDPPPEYSQVVDNDKCDPPPYAHGPRIPRIPPRIRDRCVRLDQLYPTGETDRHRHPGQRVDQEDRGGGQGEQ